MDIDSHNKEQTEEKALKDFDKAIKAAMPPKPIIPLSKKLLNFTIILIFPFPKSWQNLYRALLTIPSESINFFIALAYS